MRHTALWTSLLAAALCFGCGGNTDTSTGPGGGSPGGGGPGGGGSGGTDVGGTGGGGSGGAPGCDPAPSMANSDAIDLLLVIDNSRGMADKQAVLAQGIPRLVGMFTNPRCLDANGVETAQPSDASQDCPSGSVREFDAVGDIHIGVVSTSIGGHGSDACSATTTPSENDAAHLIARSDADGTPVATWDDKGFLLWDPTQAQQPAGDCSAAELAGRLSSMILGAGEVGCGYEAQLESWYRFLIDPDPYQSISVQNGSAVLQGTDQALLQQRATFLRPDSQLVILLLSDENDCSTRDGGQYFFSNQIFNGNNPYHLPKPRAACASDPNDPCCRSCGQTPGNGCSTAQDDCNSGPLNNLQDNINVRCFDQKRRFGIDFLYPVDRYVTGLTASQVVDRFGNVVSNPLFVGTRTPGQVFFAGIVGVPWQDIARRNGGGTPDLKTGLDASAHPVGGVQSAAELTANGSWDVILGNPATYVDPSDPLMIEAINPRSGSNPITGDAIAAPGAGYLANPINGHEYTVALGDDLQYACIFPLSQPRDCTVAQGFCECNDPSNDNPLCQAPNGTFGTTQYQAKAYPAHRQLQVMKAIGGQGVVGSVCPAQLGDDNAADWAYRPTFTALAEAMRGQLSP